MGAHPKDKKAVFQTYRTSVSFMCTYSNKGNPCNPDEWAAAVGWLLVSCSSNGAGGIRVVVVRQR